MSRERAVCSQLIENVGSRRITRNSIPATAFKTIAAPKGVDDHDEDETVKGLRVADRGFLNTAVIESQITYIDGDAGGLYSVICSPYRTHIY